MAEYFIDVHKNDGEDFFEFEVDDRAMGTKKKKGSLVLGRDYQRD